MQGVLGYFHYMTSCMRVADKNRVIDFLPKDKYQMTNDWERYYKPIDLYNAMEKHFPYCHARICLVSIISIFESVISDFIDRLNETGHESKKFGSYKSRLKWVFNITNESTYGSSQMIERIPENCLVIDHARRIRNLWLHNNGLLDDNYGEDGIEVRGREPIVDKEYKRYKEGKKPFAINLKPGGFEYFTFPHIEMLHHLNDTIQRKYFGQDKPYSYEAEKKTIKWRRLLIGI